MAMWGVAYRGHSPSPSELMQDEEELERDMQAEQELLGYGGPELEDEEIEYEDLAEMRAGEMGAAAGSSPGGELLATTSPAQSDASLCP